MVSCPTSSITFLLYKTRFCSSTGVNNQLNCKQTIRKIRNYFYLDFFIFASIAPNIDWHNWFWFKLLFVSLVWWGILCVSDLGNRSGIIKAFFRAVLKIMDLNMLSQTASFTSLCICTCMCINILNEAFLPFV